MSESVHVGDMREVLRSWAPSRFDAVVTDPPYGLGFMGKDWDGVVPGPEFWAEALRVTALGGRLVAFGGPRTSHRLVCAIEDAGWVIEDSIAWLYGQGFPKAKSKLKPAHEPICVARKPGPIAPLNIDACRIETSEDLNGGAYYGNRRERAERAATDTAEGARVLSRMERGIGEFRQPTGRWPANVILGCACADEHEHHPDCAVALLDEQSGETGQHASVRGDEPSASTSTVYNKMVRKGMQARNDSGGASRFFYIAKASRAERERWLVEQADGSRANTHPTVKPVSLMRYLVRLVGGPRGSRILDPFCGSGTTGVACALEGYGFEGIDLEQKHVDIARARLLGAAEEAGVATVTTAVERVDRAERERPVQLGLLGGAEP